MTRQSSRAIVLVCSPGTLGRTVRVLANRGWKCLRPTTIRSKPERVGPPPMWLTRTPPPDIWVVTSRAVVTQFWRTHASWRPPLRRIQLLFAVGPHTARSLRSVGLRPRLAGEPGGQRGLLRTLPPLHGLVVVHLRSDQAGPDLARRLRRSGARVHERIVYRIVRGSVFGLRRRRLLAAARAWILASPSALEAFRRALGAVEFREAAREVEVFALGDRTARAARRNGLRRVRTPWTSTEEALTDLVVEVLGNAGA